MRYELISWCDADADFGSSRAFCSGPDCRGQRRRGGRALGRRPRRSALYTHFLVGRRHQLAEYRRRQPDRHDPHTHRSCAQHNLLLQRAHRQRRRRRQCLVRVCGSDPAVSPRTDAGNKQASVIAPPQSLNVHPYYKKYLDVVGVPVLSSLDVSDEELYQVRNTILGMLSDRPDLLSNMAEVGYRVIIYPDRFEKGGRITDLPEFKESGFSKEVVGAAGRTPYGWVAAAPEVARHCNHVLIHEAAHLVEDALRLQPGADEFIARLNGAYRTAILRGRWQDTYASNDVWEYWAEAVRAWFSPSEFDGWLGSGYQELADYDPIAAALIEDVFGNATPISFCEIQRFELRGTLTGPGSQTPQADTYILQLSMRSPTGAKKLYGASAAVRRSDNTFAFERIPIEKVFLSAAAEAPHIVIGLYRKDNAANVACPAAGFLGHDGSLVRSVNPANWRRLVVTGNHISGITLSIPAHYDWTPIHTCI